MITTVYEYNYTPELVGKCFFVSDRKSFLIVAL